MSQPAQISDSETRALLAELTAVCQLEGDVVEFGCYAGDTSVLLADTIRHQPDKWLWLYDSFAGLPAKGVADWSPHGRDFQAGALRANSDTVRHKFRKHHLPEPVIKQAWFDELDPTSDLPAKICFALLDGDFYASIRTSLALVAPKVVEGGVIAVHDYRNPALPGSAKAVNDFLAQHPEFSLRIVSGLALIDKKSASAKISLTDAPDSTNS